MQQKASGLADLALPSVSSILTELTVLTLIAGLAVRTASLERKPKSGKPHALGEPLHHPPLPEPSPAREGRDLRGGVQASPQRAHAARRPAHSRARAGQSAKFLLGALGGEQLAELRQAMGSSSQVRSSLGACVQVCGGG